MLTQAIHFSSLMALQIFNTVNAKADLGLATPLTTAASVSFFFLVKNCIHLDPECLYNHIKQEPLHTHSTSPQHQALVKQVRKRYRC